MMMKKRLVEIDGKIHEMKDVNAKHLVSEAKQLLLKSRGSAVKTIAADLEGMSPDLQRLFVSEAIHRATSNQVTLREVQEWLRTDDGVVFVFWCALRDSVGESFTIDKAREVFFDNMSKEAQAAMAKSRVDNEAKDEDEGEAREGSKPADEFVPVAVERPTSDR